VKSLEIAAYPRRSLYSGESVLIPLVRKRAQINFKLQILSFPYSSPINCKKVYFYSLLLVNLQLYCQSGPSTRLDLYVRKVQQWYCVHTFIRVTLFSHTSCGTLSSPREFLSRATNCGTASRRKILGALSFGGIIPGFQHIPRFTVDWLYESNGWVETANAQHQRQILKTVILRSGTKTKESEREEEKKTRPPRWTGSPVAVALAANSNCYLVSENPV